MIEISPGGKAMTEYSVRLPDVQRAYDKFAAPEFRVNKNGLGQQETIHHIIRAFEDENDVVYLQSPTGTGKSLMLMAIANAFDDAFYTTPQILLLDQIQNDALLKDKCKIIKGRSNYPCVHPEGHKFTCDKAMCATKNNFDCEYKESLECPYYKAKDEAMRAQTALMSFMYFQIENMYGGRFDKRDILVIDEAHTIESWVLNLISVSVKSKELPDGFSFDQIKDCRRATELTVFLHDLFHEYEKKAIELVELPYRTPESQAYLDALNGIMGRISLFLKDIEYGNRWVFEYNTERLLLQPVTIGRFMEKYIYKRASKFLFASGTILDEEIYGQCVGLRRGGLSGISVSDTIDRATYITHMIDVPSPFPLDKNVIIDASVGKMTRDNVDSIFDETLHRIELLMQHDHVKDKGLVHCHSYALLRRCMEGIDAMHHDRTISHDNTNRKERLDWWMNTIAPNVFFSVNMNEGLDLPGDSCRFQVLLKTAFPYLGDKRISARMNMTNGRRWYSLMALQQLIQANGRAIRGPEDYATFYIMDGSAIELIKRSRNILPKWFNDIFDNRGVWVDKGYDDYEIEYTIKHYEKSMWD